MWGLSWLWWALVKDEILNLEELSLELLGYLQKYYEGILKERYEVEESDDRLKMLEQLR